MVGVLPLPHPLQILSRSEMTNRWVNFLLSAHWQICFTVNDSAGGCATPWNCRKGAGGREVGARERPTHTPSVGSHLRG